MNYSKITLTFNGDLDIEDRIGFVTSLNNINVFEKWVNQRTQPKQVTKGVVTTIVGERSAINFVQSFNLDYNSTNLYELTRIDNIVIIESKVTSNDFSSFFCQELIESNDPEEEDSTLEASTRVQAVINNYQGLIFQLTDLQIIEADNACLNYRVAITTNVQADNYYLVDDSNTIIEVTENPFYFTRPRGIGFTINILLDDGQSIIASKLNNEVPGVLNSANISVNSTSSPNGGTATISLINIGDNGLIEYSLNNTDWQTSNIFPSLSNGEYTIYVRDSFGCSANVDFVMDANNITEPISYISKSNSIRYALQQTFGPCGTKANDENTLSYLAFAANQRLAYKEHQRFNSCDIIPNQIWSNYQNIEVSILKQDGSVDIITPIQLTSFIGIKDARDAISYDLGNGKTGVYFTTGNIYDYDTDVDTNEDYLLNGGLPEWGKIGNYFSINSAWYQIENIFTPEGLNSEVIVISAVYSGVSTTNIIVKSIFNRQKFEVLEFNVAMLAYNNTCFQVKITETDDRFTDKIWLSEFINVKTEHKNTIEMISYGIDNTDVFYKSGIKHLSRLPIKRIEGGYDQESEVNKGDTSSGLVSGSLHETNTFIIGPVTKEIYRMIVEQSSNEIVIINGTYYVKNGEIEAEGPFDDSNLYDVLLPMLKSQSRLKINRDEELILTNDNLEVPQLVIDSDGNFMTYQ